MKIEGDVRGEKKHANHGYRVVVVIRYLLEGIIDIRIMDMGVKVVMNVKRQGSGGGGKIRIRRNKRNHECLVVVLRRDVSVRRVDMGVKIIVNVWEIGLWWW
ncbi:hypothetical protein SNE40_021439 [Patella caerulea]|uniref:Uncharacterized protein n=1 Tax=Patella caerulea TaxID=87958 RepID=A0AAN8J0K4_PATCE